MIITKNLTKYYGNHLVLDDISFTVNKGDVYGFLGKNGAGKSTTLNILTGLIKHNKGTIEINRDSIGYLPETPMFYDFMTGKEYLDFIGKLKNMTPKAIKKRTNEILDIVTLTKAANRRIKGYSRGMKQRLGLGSILYHDPDILLLDEPSSALDPGGRKDILDIIEHQKSRDKTIFFSTHILTDVQRVANQIGILNDKKIIFESNIKDLNNLREPIVRIKSDRIIEVKNQIDTLDYIDATKINNDELIVHLKEQTNTLFKDLAQMPYDIYEYQVQQETLEDIFIRMVNHGNV